MIAGGAGHGGGMGDYERTVTVPMPVDDLFDYLSHVENLPRYMSRLTQARHTTGDEVHVEARIDPGDGDERTVGGEAWFRIDAERRRLEWGSQGPHDYHGELEVSPAGDGSTVAVRLHTLHDDAGSIGDGLDQTLTNIRNLTSEARRS